LCPRLKAISDRKLFVPSGSKVPGALERVVHANISLKAIRKGWDPLRRLLASIRTERINPELAIRRLGSTAQGDPLYRAADELGRLLRTSLS
jgi:TnpA family transposase